jgi:hypothetical protein
MMQPEQPPSGGKLVIFFEFFQVQIYNIDYLFNVFGRHLHEDTAL